MGDDNWDDGPTDSGASFNYGSTNHFGGGGGGGGQDSFDTNSDNKFGGRGRGRGGGGGFRGRGGFNRDNDDDGESGGGGFRGRGGGRGRGRGRGGGFGSSNDNENGDGGYGDNDGGDGGYRGRGGGRGRGRGRGGFGSNDDNDGGGGGGGFRRNDDDGDGGFGGRGRGRGGRGGFGGDRNGGDDGEPMEEGGELEERKIPLYIPPEPSEDENVIFGDKISAGINFAKYDDIKVQVSGDQPPKPITKFEDAGFKNLINDNIRKSGYTVPTPIQKYSIPVITQGRDLMGCAQTGSGKTAAFMLPIIQSLMSNPRDDVSIGVLSEPLALVISPTRELAIQIFEQARKFAKDSVLKVCIAYGGAGTRHQGNKIAGGCDILVCTPGRLNDFVGKGYVKFNSIRFFVLDEADRMLDQGFLPDITKVADHETMPKKGERQTIMFSATFPTAIQNIANQFMKNYVFVCVGIVGGACTDIEQTFLEVSTKEKRKKLIEIVQNEQNAGKLHGILVFVEQKRFADIYASQLCEHNFPTTSIHGDRLQSQREEALRDFKTGNKKILVATSVAARGLDIPNVHHVINVDMPKEIEEYIHRIGRTGRVGNRGKSTTFIDPDKDGNVLDELKKVLTQAGQAVPDWLGGSGGGSYGAAAGFGAEDCRDFGSAPQQMETAQPEEDW